MTNRNIKPRLNATPAIAKAEVALFAKIVKLASKKSGIPVTTLLLSDDFVNKTFALVEKKLAAA